MSKNRRIPKPEPAEAEAPSKPKSARTETGPVDTWLAATIIALIGFGVVMVYSSSAIEATVKYHAPEFFVRRQGAFALAAVVVMWVVSRFDYHRLRILTYPILASVVGMLIAVIVGFGHRAGNADRWLSLGPIHVQPAEVAKLSLILWLAYSLSKKAELIKSFVTGFMPHMVVVGVLVVLCMKQPDFGSSVVLAVLTFTLLFVAGARLPYIIALLGLVGMGAAVLVRTSGYRYARYLSWLDMESNKLSMAYQPFQSVMSFGSGGITGLGLGKGLQVLYLPEAHNDFISAIIGEELGFVGICSLMLVYLIIVARGIKIAFDAPDDYGSFLAFGIATLFGVQALTNLAVAMAIVPTKGLTLPFVSYGGSSLLVNAAAAGILLGVSRQRAVEQEAISSEEPEVSAFDTSEVAA